MSFLGWIAAWNGGLEWSAVMISVQESVKSTMAAPARCRYALTDGQGCG
jgi:hypothetical protein